jgi:hypothetical protein
MEPQKPVKGKKQFKFKFKLNLWTLATGFLIMFFVIPILIAGFQIVGGSGNVDISQALTDIKEGKVEKVLIESDKLVVTYKDSLE